MAVICSERSSKEVHILATFFLTSVGSRFKRSKLKKELHVRATFFAESVGTSTLSRNF